MEKNRHSTPLLTTAIHSGVQKKNEWKNFNETEQIVKFLASDDLAEGFRLHRV